MPLVMSSVPLEVSSPDTILILPFSTLGGRRPPFSVLPDEGLPVSPPMPHAISKPFGEYLTERIQPEDTDGTTKWFLTIPSCHEMR